MVQAGEFEEEPPNEVAPVPMLPCNDENERPPAAAPLHHNAMMEMDQDQDNEIRVNNVGRRSSPLGLLLLGGNAGGGGSSSGSSSSNQQQEENMMVGGGGEAEEAGPSSARYHYRVGMFLDVLDTVGKWCEAEVLEVDHHAHKITITYLYWSEKFDEQLPFDSPRIAPFKTHTYHGDLSQLKLSQRIEVYDETKKWREAEVVDFSDDGGHQVKVHFRGFKHSFDTWVPRAVDRIRPYGREKNLKNKRRPDNHHPPLYSHPPHHNQQQQRLQASLNPNASHTRQLAVTSDRYSHYREALARQQLAIVPVEGDGNCLFRSVSHQVYGTDAYHSLVREKVMAYMEVERQYFEPYVEGDMADFLRYLEVKRRDGVWGDDPEVQAICELYDRPAVIWVYDAAQGAKKLRTFHEAGGFSSRPDRQPMMLSYYGGGHYDSIMATDQLMGGPPAVEPPGVMEDRAIDMARQRNAAAQGVEEMKRRSDEEATEQAAVEAALRASREDFDSFTDLETALELSAQAEIQAELLRSAAEQSEAELVKKVMEDSLKDDDAGQQMEEQIMAAVLETSKAEFGSSGGGAEDDEEFKKVVQMSIADSDEQRQLEVALKLSRSQADVAMMGGGGRAAYGLMDEDDPELAAALALSMQQDDVHKEAEEAAILLQARNFEVARSKKEEEDLRKALAASLEEN